MKDCQVNQLFDEVSIEPHSDNSDPVLRIWVLSDSRPGHYSQSRGIVKALQLNHKIKLDWLDIKLRIGAARKIMRMILNRSRRRWPIGLLKFFYHIPELPAIAPDVIVSAGGNTIYANTWIARYYQCQNLFAGSLRGSSPKHFTATFLGKISHKATNNIVLDLAPTTIDPKELVLVGQKYRSDMKLENDRLWAMIIGGNGGGYTYKNNDWHNLCNGMTALSKKHNVKWLITTSPRTGIKVESLIASMLPENILADTVWYGSKSRMIMQNYLGAAEIIFCTEDSGTMITESIAAGKPVYTVAPLSYRTNKQMTRLLNNQVSLHRIYQANITDIIELDIDNNLNNYFKVLSCAVYYQLAEVLDQFIHDKITPT